MFNFFKSLNLSFQPKSRGVYYISQQEIKKGKEFVKTRNISKTK